MLAKTHDTVSQIRGLDVRQLNGAISQPSQAIRIDRAIQDKLLVLQSVRGAGLDCVRLSLQPAAVGKGVFISIPVGLVFVSNASHQNMVVRKAVERSIDESVEMSAETACINFHRSVPQQEDQFASFEEVGSTVRYVLAIANLAGVDSFVAQLAVWIVTDNVNPGGVSIGRRSLGDMEASRVTDQYEAIIARAIAERAMELAVLVE